MPTVTSENKAEFDREFLERKGMLKPKVKKEQDEAIGNANDNKNGVTGTGF